ncbi:MAG TPA: hypothetical protein PK252_09130 [Bacteroidales bacterium]|nr:hypothetical protein [Bacteroidales bacterium]
MTNPESNILIITSAKEGVAYDWALMLSESLGSAIAQLAGFSPAINVDSLDNVDSENFLKSKSAVYIVLDNMYISNQLQIEKVRRYTKIDNLNLFFILPAPQNEKELKNITDKKITYYCFDEDPETGIERRYSAFEPPDISKLFWSKVLDIAYDFLQKKGKSEVQIKKAVYLAITGPELFEYRDAIRSELIHRGYTVFPEVNLTNDTEKIAEEVSAYLSKSYISIHLIGSKYGHIIPGIESSLPELQCRLSAKHLRLQAERLQHQTFQRLVWIQPKIKPIEEKQKRFLNALRVEEKNFNTEILQISLEDLKVVLREKLDYIDGKIKSTEQNLNSVYIIYEPKDYVKVLEIVQYFEKQNVKTLLIDFVKMADTIVASHYNYLTACSSVIIYDSGNNPQWLSSKMKDLVKAPGFGRKNPFKVKAILTKNINGFSGTDNLLLDANKIDPALSIFVQKLNQN